MYVAPGRATQNGYIEPFNGRIRDGSLKESEFGDLDHGCKLIDVWVTDYNKVALLFRI